MFFLFCTGFAKLDELTEFNCDKSSITDATDRFSVSPTHSCGVMVSILTVDL